MTTTFPGFDRITSDPRVLGGKPCIRGMRVTVQQLLQILADYPNWDEIALDYPEIERADIHQALAFAATMLDDRFLPIDLDSTAA